MTAPTSYLTTAWRNDASILDVANTIAAPLRTLPAWARSTSSLAVPELTPRPGAGTGRVRISRYATDVEEAVAIMLEARARRVNDRPGGGTTAGEARIPE